MNFNPSSITDVFKDIVMRNILLLITLLLCCNAFSQEKVTYTYRQKDSSLIIAGKGTILSHDVNKFCDKCVRVEIKEGIECIQFHSFIGFKSMREIILPNSLNNIQKESFIYCTSLDNLVIPPKVRGLLGSFKFCDNLKNVILPDSIGLDMGTFDHCKSLNSLSFNNLFATSNSLHDCYSLESIEVRDSTCWCKSSDGVLYCGDRLIVYPQAKKDKCYRVLNYVREIIFFSNPFIEELYVPDHIWKIYLDPCENLKLIRSENKIFYENINGIVKMDSTVIHLRAR